MTMAGFFPVKGGGFDTTPPSRGQHRKQKGFWFVLAVGCILTVQYLSYTVFLLYPLVRHDCSSQSLCLSVIFHLLFALIVTAYIKCITTDPGAIPRHWAFYRGDVAKRRRYCKECNAWKPDRTHHCSSCARCILNMDHHCPWINNCVGFYNRKFFVQLLVYSVLGLALVTSHGVLHIVLTLSAHFFSVHSPLQKVSDVAALALVLVVSFLFFAMVQFAAFHIRLVATNLTTIENLDYNARESSKYDLGVHKNCQQVFGPSCFLWWLPNHTEHSLPVGDGIRWTHRTALENIYLRYQHQESLRKTVCRVSNNDRTLQETCARETT